MMKHLLIKKIFIIIMIIAMSLNSYAAIVGDSDGNAFTNKEEFEELKENLSSQLDEYLSSLDNKIDGAIASYLAGLNVVERQTRNILTSGWDYVVDLNGTLKNSYDYPSVNGTIAICQRIIEMGMSPTILANTTTMTGNNDWWKQIYCIGRFGYSNTSNANTRNLVKNVVIGPTLDKTKMVWAGRANKVKESWNLSIIRTYGNNPSGMFQTQSPAFQIAELLNLVRTGYIYSYTDVSNPVWKPAVRWRRGGGQWDGWGYGTTYAVSSQPQIEYLKNSEGKVKSYEHIITHKSTDSWKLCSENTINYLGMDAADVDTRRTNTWVSRTTQSGTWNGCEFAFYKHATKTSNIGLNGLCLDFPVLWTDNTYTGTENKKQIPILGYIGTSTAGSIYQYAEGDIVDEDGNKLKIRKLNEGLPIMSVQYGEQIEWEPVFKDIKVNGVSSVDEAKIILSYAPFTENCTSTDYVKMDGVAKGSFIETTSKKAKIKFTVEKGGIIYAKWVPKYTDSIINGSTYWEVTLDITKCNTYTSARE